MLKVKLDKLSNANAGQIAKITHCCNLIEAAVNSEAFRSGVLNYSFTETVITGYKGKWFWRRPIYASKQSPGFYFAHGETYVPRDVVLKLIARGRTEGSELPADETMHLTLIVDTDRVAGVTAYGYPNDDRIYLYASWVDSASPAELANTIFHEWLHNVGFEHDYERTPNRFASVPYACGDLLEDVITGSVK